MRFCCGSGRTIGSRNGDFVNLEMLIVSTTDKRDGVCVRGNGIRVEWYICVLDGTKAPRTAQTLAYVSKARSRKFPAQV
jgi:hypothetical protein